MATCVSFKRQMSRRAGKYWCGVLGFAGSIHLLVTKLFLEILMISLRPLVVCMVVLFATCVQAAGQCYKIIPIKDSSGKEKSVPSVCTALAENLNEFCDDRPMVCELKISPKHPELSLPQWSPLDIKTNMGLIEKLERGSSMIYTRNYPGAGDRSWNEFRKTLLKYQARGTTSFKSASIDLLNRGKPETIYQIDNGFCEDLNFGTARNQPDWKKVFASQPSNHRFAKVGRTLYDARYAEVMTNPGWRSRAEGGGSAFLGAKYLKELNQADVFLYGGKSYLIRWNGGLWGPSVEHLSSRAVPKDSGFYSYHQDAPGEQEDSADDCVFDYLGPDSSTSKKGK